MKRILSFDGGGIRGVFSLKVAEHLERHFRVARGRPDLVLRDEFDFFAGTSTGAIIAACLAWGMSVGEILDLYLKRGAEMFAQAEWYRRFWRSKYRADVIADFFKSRFNEGDAACTPSLLGTQRLWHGGAPKYLLMVMRNASTGGAWPVTNNPAAKFNDEALPDCNLRVPLWQLLRASTAAPTFFPPEEISMAGNVNLFVDGGLTPYNNPALIAALMATLPQYRIGWRATVRDLQVVSIGTGHIRAQLRKQQARELNTLDFAQYIAPAMISSVATEQDMLCRVLGECVHGGAVDAELGEMRGDGLLAAGEKKFSYLRYDRRFTAAETAEIERSTGMKFSLDNLLLIPELLRLGEEYAAGAVRADDLGL